jgi:sirohydrochlorin cobaltochelatase
MSSAPPSPARKALVLVGHGSARNPGTRKPICANVRAIKARGGFDEVRCGLWKEDPHISVTLDALTADEIYIVPFFIADGYYTRTVIPEQMNLSGPLTRRDGKILHYTRSVGGHPRFADLILRHARDAGWRPGDALVVLGHGTERNPASGTNVYLQTERLRRTLPREDLRTAFIDQPPFIQTIWETCGAPRIIVVPLFIADGWHVTETIPEDLGLENNRAVRSGRELVLTSAVGTDPGLVEVILALVDECRPQNNPSPFQA